MEHYGGGHDSDSDDGEFIATFYAVVGHAINEQIPRVRLTRDVVHRNREEAHERLVRDYFAPDCIYGEREFLRRFRMHRDVFLRICNALEEHSDYFKQRPDARDRMGFTALSKCTAAIRYLGYGVTFDATDEYLAMSERTARESVEHFCDGVIEVFGREYLRKPTRRDIENLYEAHDRRWGLPGMIGSLDCTHWNWERCPTAHKGMYTRGDIGEPSFILEAVASHDLWI